MTPEDIATLVRDSRAAQGLPPHVEDPEALRRVAELIGEPRSKAPAIRRDSHVAKLRASEDR